MDQPDVFRRVLEFFDAQAIPYAIVGSVAAMSYGESRMTTDMDLLADVRFRHVKLFLAAFPGPEWYVSELGMQDAIRNGKQFNIIHPHTGHKVDVIIPKTEAHAETLQRASRRPIEGGVTGQVAHPNDIIIGKLRFYSEGASQKHLSDIATMIKISPQFLDLDELARKAGELGLLPVWDAIIELVRKTPPPPSDFKMEDESS